jgi:hypothetical protein
MPRGEEREYWIGEILASDRHAERLRRHLNDISAERAGKARRPVRSRGPGLKSFRLL